MGAEINDAGCEPLARHRAGLSRELSFSNGFATSAQAEADPQPEEVDEDTLNAGSFSFVPLGVGSEGKDGDSGADCWRRKNDEFQKEDDSGYSMLDGATSSNTGRADPEGTSLVRTIVVTLFYVLLWYTFSTALTLYNKQLLGKKRGKFPAPLLLNTVHFTMQAVVSSLLLRFCFPHLAPASPISWRDYLVRVVPAGVATALDVDLTNASLVFITVTFVTMCKSATPIFLLFFAFLFKLEKPSFKLFAIILIISLGVLLTVAEETDFNLVGFILIMLAAIISGFRWVVTQLLLQRKEYGLNNPLAAMSYFAPIMAVLTAGFSLILEPWHKLAETEYFDTRFHTLESFMLVLLGGTLAFFMVMAEYMLISKTSAVTMTVAGVVKEIVTITGAILYFHDQFTIYKGVGLIVILIGVGLFNWFKYVNLVEAGEGKPLSDGGIEIGNVAAKYTILEDDIDVV